MLNKTDYNPDVLTCLANLSNDEVFTPPKVANQVLDMLPQDIFQDKDCTFLDPATKSGVFLREIAKRLMVGLKKEIPDEQERVNHILTKQLFGLALTELTALLSRRSVYCSKDAAGEYSVCDSFSDGGGNILLEDTQHQWEKSKCKHCGASQSQYERDSQLETHAYQFLHTENPEELFNMKFDVIIGNPPYQLGDGGAQKSASPIYHKFVTQAKKLKPSFLAMIIPARWYTGGKGLDSFRAEMLEDEKICEIHDFPSTKDCFPGVNVRGGICYFLRDSGHKGDCNVFSHRGDEILGPVSRPLLEEGTNIFVRFNEAVGILKKVQLAKEPSFSDLVSSRKAFGLNTLVKGKGEATSKTVKLYRDRGQVGYIERGKIVKNAHWIDEWKVLVPYSSPGGDDYPHLILGNPIVSGPGSCATETHLVVGPFPSEKVCENARLYMKSKFLRFLVMLSKASQHVTRKTYQFVPEQDFSEKWSDEKLYQKYSLNEDEISFIESMIKQRD